MNARALTAVLVLGWVTNAQTQQLSSKSDAGLPSLGALSWNIDSNHWARVISQRPSTLDFQIGKSTFAVSGPMVDAFRRNQLPTDASLGRKLAGLPVVRSFVPQPMASPPGGTGNYFAWGNSSRPWSEARPAMAAGAAFSSPHCEPAVSLISIGRRNR